MMTMTKDRVDAAKCVYAILHADGEPVRHEATGYAMDFPTVAKAEDYIREFGMESCHVQPVYYVWNMPDGSTVRGGYNVIDPTSETYAFFSCGDVASDAMQAFIQNHSGKGLAASLVGVELKLDFVNIDFSSLHHN